MRSATLKKALLLLAAAPAFLFAASLEGGGSRAPLSEALGTYSFTQELIDTMNATLLGYRVLTTDTIFITLSGDGTAEGDVSLLLFNNKSYTFKGTYEYKEDGATFVLSKLTGKKIRVVDGIFGKGTFDAVTSFFVGKDSPLVYANGKIMGPDGTVFFVKK